MADIILNVAKGRIAAYADLAAASDAFIMVPLETTGLEADSVLRDYNDLGALLAAANNEQTTMGRQTVTGVTVTVDDTNDRVDVDFDDVVWTAATGNAISALLLCYDGDTGAGTDSNIVPIAKFDFVVTPNGGDITAQVPVGGALRAS